MIVVRSIDVLFIYFTNVAFFVFVCVYIHLPYIYYLEPPMSVNFGCVFEIFAQLEPVPSDIKLLQLLEYEKGN